MICYLLNAGYINTLAIKCIFRLSVADLEGGRQSKFCDIYIFIIFWFLPNVPLEHVGDLLSHIIDPHPTQMDFLDPPLLIIVRSAYLNNEQFLNVLCVR